MESIALFIATHVAIAPFLIFFLLILAGFCLPISEDAMIFLSALLAHQNPNYFWQLFAGVYLGAYLGDLIAYSLGRFLGIKILTAKGIRRLIHKKRIEKVAEHYKKYGILAIFIGRFIPFGVRNALFITAGVIRMRPVKFLITDFLACTLSTGTFFALYYHFGNAMVAAVKRFNLIIGIALAAFLLLFVIKKILSCKNK